MASFPLAIVTGGAHRLGRAFALTLAYQGYGVLIQYHRSSKHAQKTIKDIISFDVPGFSFEADLTDQNDITRLFEYVDSIVSTPDTQVTGLSVLVNSAARMKRTELHELSVEDWNETIDLNLRAPFLCAQQAALRMVRGGQIVNITDIGAQKVWSRFPSYTVSKAGLESLTRVLARSLAPAIRVNAIAPGLIIPDDQFSSKDWDTLTQKLPLKRAGTIEELTSALEFLLNNPYVTGQTVVVDGGYSLI